MINFGLMDHIKKNINVHTAKLLNLLSEKLKEAGQ